MCARVAGILAPLIRLLDVYHFTIPMLIYGIIPIAAAGFCLLLPETCNAELQDHAELTWVDEPFHNRVLTSLKRESKQFYMIIFLFLISETQRIRLLRWDPCLTQKRSQKCNLYGSSFFSSVSFFISEKNCLPILNW